MLTIFSTYRPFQDHVGIIHVNALRNWKLIHPDIEIILFSQDAERLRLAESWRSIMS
jgi:hypothetical protein